MSEGEMLVIKVPGSTANLGPGFDSIGLALNLYLTLEAERADRFEMIPLSAPLSIYPTDESNFIFQVARDTAKKYGRELPACKVRITSDIPLTRGLGSSAAAIVAGIELADSLCNLHLSQQEKLELSSRMEGHPDNAGASLLGGMVIGCQSEDEVHVQSIKNLELDVVAVVPKEELLTKESRGVLPEEWSFKEAVQAGAVGNVMVAALLSGNYPLAGKMMQADLYHHPYRKKMVPHLEVIEKMAPELGAFGVALSGAGPAVLCLAEAGLAPSVAEGLQKLLPDMDILCLQIDQAGSSVLKKSLAEEQEPEFGHI
ncbi:homoserine kinase [Bacillus sp. ISL-47]|uniref:homoserine kinase n=1 Tax=Bacillus sp. ISL-47 TaxID=2819130 RepID=UPI001BE849F2|nr:homoserine kinase [Bacillus sp. ISL-47]MBT2687567.1 homoserine kinase [Bacillus sp. ISL-47]MBT2706436.1 homoserine kinase [Pseudomonas sp. ISL-84]